MKSKSSRNEAKAIFVVDDHPMMRKGLAELLEQEGDLRICGEAESAPEALQQIERLKPDLAIVDISLKGGSGLELIKHLQAILPDLPVLVISMHDESLYAERVLRAGGRGYINKQEGGKKLVEAIRQVLSGQIYVSDRMTAKILHIFSAGRGQAAGKSPIEQLTDREFEVFQLIGNGQGTREIAKHLNLSVKTVEVHRANIKQKLNLKTAPELIRYAVRWVETENG